MRMITNHHATLCKGVGTDADVDVKTARHLLKYAQVFQLKHWAEDLCPHCVAQVQSVGAK